MKKNVAVHLSGRVHALPADRLKDKRSQAEIDGFVPWVCVY